MYYSALVDHLLFDSSFSVSFLISSDCDTFYVAIKSI